MVSTNLHHGEMLNTFQLVYKYRGHFLDKLPVTYIAKYVRNLAAGRNTLLKSKGH